MVRKVSNFFEPRAIRQMNDQRIEPRAFLSFKDFCNCNRRQRISRESVNGLGGQCDDLALAHQFNRRSAVG
jgi:hypothetical protein